MQITSVTETLADLQKKVRGKPSDARERVFLFQLLALTGQWQRAATQLDVAGELDAGNALMARAYRALLICESLRAKVFAGQSMPQVVGEPEQWLASLLLALQLGCQEQWGPAKTAREQAFDAAPALPGTINGERFEWLADADQRFGPCLELVLNGGYYWAPLSRIKQLKIEPPSDLRDKVWTPVAIQWTNGGEAVGFIPSRYPGSERSADNSIVLGSRTDWLAVGEDDCIGLGQRMFATNQGEYPLFDVRTIVFDSAA